MADEIANPGETDAAELAGVEAAGETAVEAGGLGDGGVGGTAVARMALQDTQRKLLRAQLRREVEALGLNPNDYPANGVFKQITVTSLFAAGPQPDQAPVYAEPQALQRSCASFPPSSGSIAMSILCVALANARDKIKWLCTQERWNP